MGTRSLTVSLTLCISLLALSCLGQAYTYRDMAFMGVARPVAAPPADPWAGYPTNISGYPVLAWWPSDAASVTNASGGLTNWLDWSGNGNTLTNEGNPLNTAFVTNLVSGHPNVRFGVNGENRYVRRDISLSTPWEIIYVMRYYDDALARNAILKWMGTENGARGHYADALDDLGSGSISDGPLVTNKWMVWGDVYNAAAGQSSMRTNNVTEKTGTANISGTVLGIGATYAGGASAPTEMLEVILWATNLTDTVRTNVYSYLTNKYKDVLSPP